MTTLLLTHPDCLAHVTPPGHPEQVARMQAIAHALDTPDFKALRREDAPFADPADLRRCHPQAHIDALKARMPLTGTVQLDPDTHAAPGTWAAALRGVGAACRAVDAVVAGEVVNAFAAMRPPGHHAEAETPMGFCLFGNIAIAAKRALDHHGLTRIAVVDFDVHHGNGTQDLLWDEPRALFVSTHQMPLWPGTGLRTDTNPQGTILNRPLPAGCDGAHFRRVIERDVLPALDAHRPELLLISAGFDAHSADPLAALELEAEDFAWVTHRLCDIADAHCGGRVVSTLEGGYDLDALAASAAAHVRVLMERGA